jgi:hypothetical protein
MTESLSYEVLRSSGPYEVRRYPLVILATVRGMSDYEAFSILFRYISGENSRTEKVPMTAPVMSGVAVSEHIPMTVPVVSDPTSFSFALPSGYSPADTPEPSDRRVNLEVVPGRHLAVLRFRGRAGQRAVAGRYKELSEWVGKAGLSPKGSPFLMRYNPPYIPGFLRRNEVATEVLL